MRTNFRVEQRVARTTPELGQAYIQAWWADPSYSRVDPCGQPISIKLSRKVKQEAKQSVGARVVDGGLGGPSWSPVGGEVIVFLQAGSQGTRTRATMKAHPTAPHHPRSYGI